jgi:hypothetical protein
MNWYLTQLIFRIVSGAGNHQSQFEVQWRLMSAPNPQEGLHKARKLGLEEQIGFFNQQQQWVQWQFIDVAECFQLDWQEGALLHDTTIEMGQAEGFIQLVRDKAARIGTAPATFGT